MLIIKTRLLFLSLILFVLLSGCSPHPGSGIWVPMDKGESRYSKVEVLFDGRAELFVPGREDHLYRCFWGGVSSESIRMECVSADDDAIKPIFKLQVAADGRGELLESEKTVGYFRRTEEKPIRD